jgi:uncharacterized RDD family membrane protein YckC
MLFEPAGFLRRFAALIYDSLVLTAITLCTGLIYSIIFKLLGVGEPADFPLILQLTLFPLVLFNLFYYYAYSWQKSGQTLGMRAWKIKTFRTDLKTLEWKDSLKRAGWSLISWVALCGLGLISCFFRDDKKSLQDIMSQTQVLKEIKT